jgi:hypothetical protein
MPRSTTAAVGPNHKAAAQHRLLATSTQPSTTRSTPTAFRARRWHLSLAVRATAPTVCDRIVSCTRSHHHACSSLGVCARSSASLLLIFPCLPQPVGTGEGVGHSCTFPRFRRWLAYQCGFSHTVGSALCLHPGARPSFCLRSSVEVMHDFRLACLVVG